MNESMMNYICKHIALQDKLICKQRNFNILGVAALIYIVNKIRKMDKRIKALEPKSEGESN